MLRRAIGAWRALPELVRFVIRNGAVGFALSAVLLGALLAADPGGARGLLLHAAGHWWPAAALWFFTGLTFGSAQIGVATMLLAGPPAEPPRGGRRAANGRGGADMAFPAGLAPAVTACRPRGRRLSK